MSHGLARHDHPLRLRPVPDGSLHLLRHPHQVRYQLSLLSDLSFQENVKSEEERYFNESVMVSLNLATREIETDETFECLLHEQMTRKIPSKREINSPCLEIFIKCTY